MASALLDCQMNTEAVISSLLIYVISRAILLCTAQAPPRSISSLEDIPPAMIRQRHEHRSSRSSKQEPRGGASLCCRGLERQSVRSHASSKVHHVAKDGEELYYGGTLPLQLLTDTSNTRPLE